MPCLLRMLRTPSSARSLSLIRPIQPCSTQRRPPACAVCCRMRKTFALLSTRPHLRLHPLILLRLRNRTSSCRPKCRPCAKSSWPATGELLTPELMPAPELLSALQHAFATGASPWLPWRSRCTEADAISWHDARRPRTDRQLLRIFLEAEEESPGPTAFVPNSGPIEPTVRKALSVHATALSMLEKVHLLVIKRFNDKFLSFALSVPSDPSLRGPSLQEILAADRAVWQSVHALMRDQSWTLSDSLDETFCRQDMSSALQPRPRVQRPPQPSPTGGQKRKRRSGGGQGGNNRPKPKAKPAASAQQVPAAKAFDKSWFKKVNGIETCVRGALRPLQGSELPAFPPLSGPACQRQALRSEAHRSRTPVHQALTI